MAFPPEAYLIGAQKAGTTTLAYLLDQHPDITVSQPKESHFFAHNRDKGLDWYKEQFPESPGTICLDASTSYSMAPLTEGPKRNKQKDKEYEGVPAEVYSVNPYAKFIYLLRDPVERTYSGYWHSVRMGDDSEEFRTTILGDPFYLDVSDYYGQLLLWLSYFPLESFFIVLFEEMKENPERVVRECCKFLGVSEEITPMQLDSPKNQSRRVGWLGRRMNKFGIDHPDLRVALKSVAPASVEKLLTNVKSGSKPIPTMNEEDRRFLAEYFRERNRKLEELTGLPLTKWQH